MSLYRPLNESISEIRLLHILPETSSPTQATPADISCVLHYVSLNNSPKYHALSYTWRLPESDVPFDQRETCNYTEDGRVNILLDGHVFPVTFNLWSALKHFRSLQSTASGWAESAGFSDEFIMGINYVPETPCSCSNGHYIWIDAVCTLISAVFAFGSWCFRYKIYRNHFPPVLAPLRGS